MPPKYRIIEERPDGVKVPRGEFSTMALLLPSLDRALEGSFSQFLVMIVESNKVLFRTQGSELGYAGRALAAP